MAIYGHVFYYVNNIMLLSMFVSLTDNLSYINQYNNEININLDSWKNAEQFLYTMPGILVLKTESFLNLDGNVFLEFCDPKNFNLLIRITFNNDLMLLELIENNKVVQNKTYTIQQINDVIDFIKIYINFYE